MEKATTTGARAVKAFRDRKREAGEIELRGVWVPAELVEQVRRAAAMMVELHKGRQKLAAPPRECKCGLRTRLVGDGCNVCNPKYAEDHADKEQK